MLGLEIGILLTIITVIGSLLLGGLYLGTNYRTIFAIHREWALLSLASVGHFVCVFFAIALPELLPNHTPNTPNNTNNNQNNNNNQYTHSPPTRIVRSLLPLVFLLPLVLRVVRLVCVSAAHHVTVNSLRVDEWASTMQAVLHRTRTTRFISLFIVLTVLHTIVISFLLFVPSSTSLRSNGDSVIQDHCNSINDMHCLLEPSGRQVFRWGVEWGVDVYELCVWGVGLCVFAWWTSYVRMDGICLGVELYWSFGIVTSSIVLVWILAQFSPVAANIIVALVGPLNVLNALFWAHRNTNASTSAHAFSRGLGPHPFLEQPLSPPNRNTHHFTQSIDFRIPASWMQRSSLNVNAENNAVAIESAATSERTKYEHMQTATTADITSSSSLGVADRISRKAQRLSRPAKSMGAKAGSFRMRLSLSHFGSTGSGVSPTADHRIGGASGGGGDVDTARHSTTTGFGGLGAGAMTASMRISEATFRVLRRLISTATALETDSATATTDRQNQSSHSIKPKAGRSSEDWEKLRDSTVSNEVLVSISLDMVLKYEPAALAFRQHLCKEFSSENLVAYVEVCNVLEVFETHTLEAIIRAQQLYHRFLCPTSLLQVNISPLVGDAVGKALQDVLKNSMVKKALQVQTTTTKRVTSVKTELYMASLKQRMSAPVKFRRFVEARKSLKRQSGASQQPPLTQIELQKQQQQFQQPAKEMRGLSSKNSGNKIPKRKNKEPPAATATTSAATNPPARNSGDHTNSQRHSWGSAPTQRNSKESAELHRLGGGALIIWGGVSHSAQVTPAVENVAESSAQHVVDIGVVSAPATDAAQSNADRGSDAGSQAPPTNAIEITAVDNGGPEENNVGQSGALSLPPTPNLNSSRSNNTNHSAPTAPRLTLTPQMNLRLTPRLPNKQNTSNSSLPSPAPSNASSRLLLPLSPTPFRALQNSVRNSFSPLPMRPRPPSAPLCFVDNTQLAVLGVSLDPNKPELIALKDSLILMKKRTSSLMSQDALMRFLLGRSFAEVVSTAGIFPWDEKGELVATTKQQPDPTLVLEPPQESAHKPAPILLQGNEPQPPPPPIILTPQALSPDPHRALTLEELPQAPPHQQKPQLLQPQHDDLQVVLPKDATDSLHA